MSKEQYSVQEEHNGRLSITIPKALGLALGMKQGTKIKWKVKSDKELILEKN